MDYLIKRFFEIFRQSANNQQPSQQGSGLAFGLCLWMKLLLGALSIILFLLGVVVWMALMPEGGPYLVLLIPFGLLFALVIAKPTGVVTDETGVLQTRWFRSNEIPWSEVVEAVRNPDNGCTDVRGKWGTMISFSPYLVAQDRYDKEILVHTKLAEIPNYI
jgi:hypothetical protein